MTPVVRVVYRVQLFQADNVPESGPVLLTPNHVSYVDALLIYGYCPRPVQFIIDKKHYDKPFFHLFCTAFNAIPIRRDKPHAAIISAVKALNEDAVVCIFPEGKLTKDGSISEIQRGFELIARKAKCPVLPARTEGLSGSAFCVKPNWSPKMIFKAPWTKVSLTFGRPIPWNEATAERVADQLRFKLVKAKKQ